MRSVMRQQHRRDRGDSLLFALNQALRSGFLTFFSSEKYNVKRINIFISVNL